MGIRFLKRHSILAGAALLILAVAATMLANGGNRGPEPAPFLAPVPSSSQGTASSSGAPSSQAEASAPSSSQPAAQAVQSALKQAMRARVADGGITTLRQFIEEQERLKAELQELVKPLE